jgi:hypothetical protein
MKNKIYKAPIVSLASIVLENAIAASSVVSGTDFLDMDEGIQRYEYEELPGHSDDFFIN